MKLLYILMFIPFLNCSGQSKLNIETIFAKPTRVTDVVPETGKTYYRNTYIAVTKRLDPSILLQTKTDDKLKFLLQGNISSQGLSAHKIKKIRFEKGDQQANSITLKYYVEIAHVPGKEGATVHGYNYSKEIFYKIPKNINVVLIELYEDRITQRTGSKIPKLKLVANEIFDNFTKM